MSDSPLSSSLDHYTIASGLGTRLKSGGDVEFGVLGLRKAHAEWALLSHTSGRSSLKASDPAADRLILDIADRVRTEAYGREYVLAFARRRNAFHEQCREAGLNLPEETLNARLLALAGERSHEQFPRNQVSNVEKNTTAYLRVFEFAASKLRYEYGASLDDVLTQPEMGFEFDRLCSVGIPNGLSSDNCRLSLLAIRKARLFESLALGSMSIGDNPLESISRSLGALSKLSADTVPKEPGIVVLLEHHEPTVNVLFVEVTNDTRAVSNSFLLDGVFKMMEGEFWQPNPATLSLRCVTAETLGPVSMFEAFLGLMGTQHPVFNVPLTVINKMPLAPRSRKWWWWR